MRITPPYPVVPGDNEDEYTTTNGTHVRPRIMARSGSLLGVRGDEAIWSFGFAPGSEAALVYERESPEVRVNGDHDPGEVRERREYGPLFVRSTVKTGAIRETFRGFALELPKSMRRVLEGGR